MFLHILIFQFASFITITKQDELDHLIKELHGKQSYVIGLKNMADTEGPLTDGTDLKEGKNVQKVL